MPSPLVHTSLVDPSGNWRKVIRDAYRPSGGAKGQIRRNQLMPLHWQHLTPGDIWEISKALWAEPASDATAAELEAMLAVSAILTTGRNLGRLHPLKLYKDKREMAKDDAREGIVMEHGELSWHLLAGSPARQKEVAQRARALGENVAPLRPKSEKATDVSEEKAPKNVYRRDEYARTRPVLKRDNDRPITLPVAPAVKMCLARCGIGAGQKSTTLFRMPIEVLIPLIERFLTTRRGPNIAEPRRCSNTLESITRYLMTEMTFQAGADIATAARLTDSTHYLSKSVIFYGVTKSTDLDKGMRRATTRLRGNASEDPPVKPKEQWLGSFIAPTDPQVRELVRYLERIPGPEATPEDTNRAMVIDTVALVSFAIGHRGEGSHLPASSAIDEHTGFCRVNEKFPDDPSEVRMVWVDPTARQQIAKYERHLESLAGQIPTWLFQSLRQEVSEGRLPFYKSVRGIVGQCTLESVWQDLARDNPRFDRFVKNSGRHWLRSNLEGYCSTETLHALFGHWHHGTEPWSYGSCLDPIIYREDLARTIPVCLAIVGWKGPRWPSR